MERLADMPALGSRYESHAPELTGVRFFPVTRYRNYLVFYRPTATGIEVLRVLHGAQDIERILGGED
jgi:toxin ParE1/3/4